MPPGLIGKLKDVAQCPDAQAAAGGAARRARGADAGPGQANLKKVQLKLPLSQALDPDRAQSDDMCELEAGKRVDCPASSIIGRARARSVNGARAIEQA